MTTTQTLIDLATVPRRREGPDVEWVEVEGEIVAWVQETESLHLLDPIATLVFQLCDGSASVLTTTAELAEAFGQPRDAIAADVMTCVVSLHDQQLVQVD